MRLGIPSAVLILAAGLAGSGGAAPASAPRPRTLVTSPTQILQFAGDGDWIAWSARERHCAVRFHLLSIRTHRHVEINGRKGAATGCENYGSLALAGTRVAWTSLVARGHTELDVAVHTASAAARVPRRARSMAMIQPEFGPEPLPPPIAGRGATIAYYRHDDGIGGSRAHTVERLAGSRPQRLFRSEDPVALAVDGGRTAAVQRRLERGDACNCNFDPAWSPDGTKIAFISGRGCCVGEGEQDDVYVMNADGSDRHRITTDATPKRGVAWAPDGARLAFGYVAPKFALELAVVNADGSGRHDIAAGGFPSWSPDGARLAYDDGGRIAVVDADGANPHEIGVGTEPAWSPDGSRIAFNSPGYLYSSRVDGTDKRRLALGVNGGSWSPDGTMVAGYSLKGIKLVRADGSGAALVTGTHRGDSDPSWSPDGKRIAFDSTRNDLVPDGKWEPELYAIDASGGAADPLTFLTYDQWYSGLQVRSHFGRLLYSTSAFGEPLALTLDGRWEVVLARGAHTSAERLQVFHGPGSVVRAVSVPSSTSSISARGGRVVYVAGKTIRFLDLHSGAQRVLAFTAGPVVGVTISGRHVTWAENVGQRGRIRTVQLAR